MEFRLPYQLRPSKVNERRSFYSESFRLKNSINWLIKDDRYLALAFDVGTETTRYRPRFKKYLNKLVYIRNFENQEELKDKIIRYLPEDIYFSNRELKEGETLDNYDLVFKLDPRDFECESCRRKRKRINENAIVFCESCANDCAEETLRLLNLLKRHFSEIKVVYEGLGFYLIIKDREANNMSPKDRKKLNKKVKKEFVISSEITAREKDLIRLPGSLNGLVSRKAIEINPSSLNNAEKIYQKLARPDFLK